MADLEQVKQRKKNRRPATKSDAQIAAALLKAVLPRSTSADEEEFEAIHDEMRREHRPQLPLQFDWVERAAELKCRLRQIRRWESGLFRTMKEALENEAEGSSNASEKLCQLLEVLFRQNILEKIGKREAALRDELRKLDQPLQDLGDWHIDYGSKRGTPGYTTSAPMTREEAIRFDELLAQACSTQLAEPEA